MTAPTGQPDPDPLTVEPVEGWETARYRAVERPVVDRGAIAWTTAAFLVLIGLVLLVLAQLSAPRSASEGSTAPAVSPVGSQGQSGAPNVPLATVSLPAGVLDNPAGSLGSGSTPGFGAPSADDAVVLETAAASTTSVVSVSAPDTAAIGTAEQALRGVATWYAAPSRRDAAAGPLLREALGKHWRGRWVTVTANGHSILAHLTDWCLCSKDRRLVDLDSRAFARLAPLSQGVVDVTVSWSDGEPLPTGPPTDVAP